jgi:hypothetical protein
MRNVMSIVSGAALTVMVVGCDPPPRPACRDARDGGREVLRVDVGQRLGAIIMPNGYLHGSQEGAPLTDLERVRDLGPHSWRTASTSEHEVYADIAEEITYVIPDDFDAASGGGQGTGKPYADFAAYDRFVSDLVTRLADDGPRVDYWDLGAEPNWSFPGTPAQWRATVVHTIEAVRGADPNAKIVGPSVGAAMGEDGLDITLVTDFIDFIADEQLTIDAVSWHEFNLPDELEDHLDLVRAHMRERLGTELPIHINEYGSPKDFLVPAWNLAWFATFEKAQVASANRACWAVSKPFGSWNSCWVGLGGLFLEDNETPQAPYWVHRGYARMADDERVSADGEGKLVALASVADDGDITILVGRRDRMECRGGPARVTVAVESVGVGARARVVADLIPEQGPSVALHQPRRLFDKVVDVDDDAITVDLGELLDGDVAHVVVTAP